LIAENLLLKHQLLLVTRSRKRAPNLSPLDRFLLGLWTILLDPRRLKRTAILVKPSTRYCQLNDNSTLSPPFAWRESIDLSIH
jgi:hypothetical protein